MSWGTILTTEIYFSKEHFNDLGQVETAIEEEEAIIERAKQSIMALAVMTEPQKMLTIEEGMSPLEAVQYLTEESFKSLEESLVRLTKLNYLKDNWKSCHNDKGEPVPRPEDQFGKSYLDLD